MAAPALPAVALHEDEANLHAVMDDTRISMEDSMTLVREQCRTYLNWYSPPFDTSLRRHDAWEDPVDFDNDYGHTRDNFTISRAAVDIWTSLEAARPPMARAEPIDVSPPPPEMDRSRRAILNEQYALERTVASRESEIRGRVFRDWLRRDEFALKHHKAVRRKNLYGFSWMMVLPDARLQGPRSHVLRNPTTVFPVWNSHDPDEMEAVLSVQQESAVRANAKYGLGLNFEDGRLSYHQPYLNANGRYSEVDQSLYFDDTRTKVWVEDMWWSKREYDDNGLVRSHSVFNAKRICGKIVGKPREYPWYHLPFVYWQNEDERSEFGWSEVASVMDINDEFNRRISEESDVLGMYARPRFQHLGSMTTRQDIELPGPDEILSLEDPERIEQILTRIDVYPIQVHINTLIDLLHRVTGLPPIVWGLIANAQTSGRALTASWKATEARLVPKLMANRASIRRYSDIAIDYALTYDWARARDMFLENDGSVFEDIRWTFPPMEPRDFQEVTMDAITRRDAGLTTTVQAMRDTGEENAEIRLEEVIAEFRDPTIHPDRAQAILLYEQANIQRIMQALELRNMLAQQGGGGMPAPQTPATTQQMVQQAAIAGGGQAAAPPGMEGALPPTQPGAAGNAGQPGAAPAGGQPQDETLTSGTLVRGGNVSNQLLQTRRQG